MKRLKVTVGILAHNEETNINQALASVVKAKLVEIEVEKIVIVSSGSFDATNKLVRRWGRRDKRIKLLMQSRREGKAAAINFFIRQARSPILVTMSADIKLAPMALEELCLPFWDIGVGMVGAHPVPVDRPGGQLNREIALLWQLHHEISLIKPKCGEMVAFRNIIRNMPEDSAVDEATLEVLLTLLGYNVVYAPRAIVYNRGVKTYWEFMKQRRRVQTGHEWVRDRYHYRVATVMPGLLLKVVLNHLGHRPQDTLVMVKLLSWELVARALGFIDYYVWQKNPYTWPMVAR
ncbi:hypothetical protein A2W24_04840 [Microgenomates group bacterium RBG_16_45_19]|nr:MAG: hypothetical protein A2W24_04840 [Microgenomates group bacterium RBG_16_45_19]